MKNKNGTQDDIDNILSLDEPLRIDMLKKYKTLLNINDIIRIIKSLSEEKRIPIAFEIQEEYYAEKDETEIISDNEDNYYLSDKLSMITEPVYFKKMVKGISDDALIQTLKKMGDRFTSEQLFLIIKNIKDLPKKLDALNQAKEVLQRYRIRDTLKTMDDNTKIELYIEENFDYNKRTKMLKMPISQFLLPNQMPYFKCLNFSYFNAEIMVNTIKNYKKYTDVEWAAFLNFAKALGCFSDKKILDKNGKETNAVLGQKATSSLRDMLRYSMLNIGSIYDVFSSFPPDIEADQNFFRFISQTIGRKKYENLEMLLNLENEFPGIFIKVMTNFEQAEKYRYTLDEKGMPIKVPWKITLQKFFMSDRYEGVTEENSDIAETFARKGIPQKLFTKASELRKNAKLHNIPEHILDKSVKEETILESIEKIKHQTEQQIENSSQIIEDLYSKKFTYEWLSKNDPRNSIMGLFVNSCGSITSETYGGSIARASVIAPDVQNIVIKDLNGNIISKGTMYVNTRHGYAVINSFELNNKYRYHEVEAGIYYTDEENSQEQDREQVFKTFQRGIQAFIDEYDREHPDNPLKQVNVGMGYNRLKRQVKRFLKETNNLTIPSEYEFLDAEQEQYILYKREEPQKDNTIDRNGDIEL